eukprot:CAMPEP_0194283158 /NCGR_PEP_ID=MMETSP0169-20130528/24768_1 /TAXON_ID=218684 /ORGANISM="Corethron pennatum, Strain L29A3" /LENGTH=122 /DNA_ID=CAMNT_0039028697 /DNA_START=141 /DNA_END=506 /DNA_ORIENTATION=+
MPTSLSSGRDEIVDRATKEISADLYYQNFLMKNAISRSKKKTGSSDLLSSMTFGGEAPAPPVSPINRRARSSARNHQHHGYPPPPAAPLPDPGESRGPAEAPRGDASPDAKERSFAVQKTLL